MEEIIKPSGHTGTVPTHVSELGLSENYLINLFKLTNQGPILKTKYPTKNWAILVLCILIGWPIIQPIRALKTIVVVILHGRFYS